VALDFADLQLTFEGGSAPARWVRGHEYGLETAAIDKEIHNRLNDVITQLEQDSLERIE
jgi:hypothetical protein